ncbi:TIGR01777 family oxidoreductase [Patiriisocius hiemis]|uniref:TIGR01777 family oxidoreductase n=1 Tax=Patiriisocius hiemis TaxID=3075604 RepID=A0ABU2YI71_9FLAO|nr:TIGR01777 family oxidoreductase [Constantimarinum sp. W242]MDT0556768.1 TIGR01777 family oxidoreductase [Constantimarinum sp. W242]
MIVLITGATGLIGSELSKLCIENGNTVHYLTTSKSKLKNEPNFKGFYWNPSQNEIDHKAFQGVSAIINLVGASISKRWTKSYKEEIVDSRVDTANLICATLEKINHTVSYFISASGISVYPASETVLYTEENLKVDTSFLANVVVAWEAAANQFKKLGIEVSIVRTGVVFDKDEGAFPKLVKPIKNNVGATLGNGEQWLSWIHIDDIVGIYYHILKNNLEGIFNAVAPNPVKNKKITKLIARELNKPLWLPNVPSFVLKLILGEMASLVLEGQLVSSTKIEELGYPFKHYNIESALDELL